MQRARPELLYWDSSSRLTYLTTDKMIKRDKKVKEDLDFIYNNKDCRNCCSCNK